MAFIQGEQSGGAQPSSTHSRSVGETVEEDHAPTPPARANITHLPLDVLVLIFYQVYYMSRKSYGMWIPAGEHKYPGVGRLFCCGGSSHWPDDENLKLLDLFPQAQASVCARWREAMSCVSVFWTRLLIVIDSEAPTPLSTVREYLAWSKDHPIDITVSRRADHFVGEDQGERARVTAVMELLYPHYARWRKLSIHVLHEASLPRPCADMRIGGPCGQLTEFCMTCRIYDGEPAQPPADDAVPLLATPVLETLEIPGLAFRETYVTAAVTLPSSVIRLVISGYGPHHEPFAVRELVDCIHELQFSSLELRELSLDSTYDGTATEHMGSVEALLFEDIHGDALTTLNRLWYIFSYSTAIERCTAPRPMVLGSTIELHLEDIQDSEHLLSLLTASGNERACRIVEIENCPGLDDALLGEYRYLDEEADAIAWVLPVMDSLTITDCTQFTSGALKKMVKARRSAHAKTGFAAEGDPGHVVTSLKYLEVHGAGELAPEDQTWFNARVADVIWNGWHGGYERERSILQWQQL